MVSLWKKQFSELVRLPHVFAIEGSVNMIEYKDENNQLHRPSYLGPASFWYCIDGHVFLSTYYNEGKRHRLPNLSEPNVNGGPAWTQYLYSEVNGDIICSGEINRYWINNVNYEEDQYKSIIRN